MMRRIVIPTLCLAVLCLGAVPALSASALSHLYPGTVNALEDNDWESVLKGDGDRFLEVGEYLVGMLEIQTFRDEWGTDTYTPTWPEQTVVAVFALEVAKITAIGSNFLYEFGAMDKDLWDTLTDSTNQNLGLTDPVADGTVGIVFSDGSNPYVDQTVSDSEADSLATALDGDKLWEIGFTGNGSNEFWTTLTNSMDINQLFLLQVRVSLNATHYYNPSIKLLNHSHLWDGVADAINPAGTYAFTNIHGYGGLSSINNGVWDISTDTDFFLYPTPEPGSIALLGLGLVACGGMIYRRRKNSA